MNTSTLLRELSAFRDLPGAVLDRIESLAFHRKLRKRETIFLEGETPAGFYLLETGLAKAIRSTRQGKDVLLDLHAPGDIIGACCGPLAGPHACSAVSLTKGSVVWVRGPTWQALLAEFASLRHAIAETGLSSRRRCVDLAVAIAVQDIDTRLAALLLRLRELGPNGGSIGVLSHQEMAEAIGTAREVVTRHLGKLTAQGILVRQGRRILIQDTDALTRLALDN